MKASYLWRRSVMTLGLLLVAVSALAQAQAGTQTFKPEVGQAGKDVVWVPTPQSLVDKMLDMAKVTPQDYVIDLGIGRRPDGHHRGEARRPGARASNTTRTWWRCPRRTPPPKA